MNTFPPQVTTQICVTLLIFSDVCKSTEESQMWHDEAQTFASTKDKNQQGEKLIPNVNRPTDGMVLDSVVQVVNYYHHIHLSIESLQKSNCITKSKARLAMRNNF